MIRSLEKEPLSKHTTFKIGGPADILYIPENTEELKSILSIVKKSGIPLTVIGNGSNLLVSDNGIKGAVIKISGSMDKITINTDMTVSAESGAHIGKLINECTEKGFSGLEVFRGIPACVGGAVAMNMGSWGSNISDFISSVEFLTAEGVQLKLAKSECNFGYRHSIVLEKRYIITSVEYILSKDNPSAIRSRSEELMNKKTDSQPLSMPSAGCVFKNPPDCSAGALIDKAGLKGMRVGGAAVSSKHANFIVNEGGAKAADVMALIKQIQETVFKKTGIKLDLEVKMLGFSEGNTVEIHRNT